MSQFRGVYVIPVTPVTGDDQVDEAGLRRWVNFALDRGSHGIVAPVNASSFSSFSDDERNVIVETLFDENRRRVPFVAGVTGSSRAAAVRHAHHARAIGADAVIAMPPYVHKAGENEVIDYYRAIAEACGLPVWVQNFIGPVGTPMPVRLLARLFNEIEGVSYLKEETEVATHVMTALRAETDKCLGFMGGKGGRFFLNEWKRGACGTMPAGHVPEPLVAVWTALEGGDFDQAWRVWSALLPLLNFEQLYGGITVYAAVLHKRGVLTTPFVRQPGRPQLDTIDHEELDRIVRELEPLLQN